jgi:hypothetical protein
MQPVDFFHSRIDAMINLYDPLAVLAKRLPWSQIETAIATKFEQQSRVSQVLQSENLSGTTLTVKGGGRSNAGWPKLPIRLMASLFCSRTASTLATKYWWRAGARPSCGSSSEAWTTKSIDGSVTPPRSDAFDVPWVKTVFWNCYSRPLSTQPLPLRHSDPKTWARNCWSDGPGASHSPPSR